MNRARRERRSFSRAGGRFTDAVTKRRTSVPRIPRDRRKVQRARGKTIKILAKFFAAKATDLAQQITSARTDLVGKLAKDAESDLVLEILRRLDLGDWSVLAGALTPLLIQIAQDGVLVAFTQIGLSAPPADLVDQVNQKARDWAETRGAELVGMRKLPDGTFVVNPNAQWAITDSTRDMLRDDIVRAIEEGTSTADLAAELTDRYVFSEARAESIARTELARADVAGNLIAYRDSGMVDGKEWLLGSEHAGPDECDDAADLGVVPLDDDFGGIGDPPAHPGCVCDISPVLADEEAE